MVLTYLFSHTGNLALYTLSEPSHFAALRLQPICIHLLGNQRFVLSKSMGILVQIAPSRSNCTEPIDQVVHDGLNSPTPNVSHVGGMRGNTALDGC